jgi:hypothetical protein
VITRDANHWGVGFITQVPLLAGYPAVLHLKAPDGSQVMARGCVLRCREIVPGWYEGAIQFQNEQPLLSVGAINGTAATAVVRPSGRAW